MFLISAHRSPELLDLYSFNLSKKSCCTGSREGDDLLEAFADRAAPTESGLRLCFVSWDGAKTRRTQTAAAIIVFDKEKYGFRNFSVNSV